MDHVFSPARSAGKKYWHCARRQRLQQSLLLAVDTDQGDVRQLQRLASPVADEPELGKKASPGYDSAKLGSSLSSTASICAIRFD